MKQPYIGGVKLINPLILAPMAGVTDFAFRHLCGQFGAALTVSEMVSVNGLNQGNEPTKKLLHRIPSDIPSAVQLFGSDPKAFSIAVKNPLVSGFDIIDINMGCPVAKVVKTGAGSALMDNPQLAHDIVRACVDNTDKPVSVKFRLGFSDPKQYLTFGKVCAAAGATAVTLHGRTRVQMYRGKADFSAVKMLKGEVDIPVIVSGDIVDRETFQQIMSETGADGAMIGRGAMGRPWIFADILGQNPPYNLTGIILRHIDLLLTIYSDIFVVKYMRHHIGWYLKGAPGAAEKRGIINKLDILEEVKRFLVL